MDDQGGSVRLARRVLLVGWDAADWKMITPMLDAGDLPNLKRFVNEGVSGNVASLQPMLSPILWTSIATGKHADKHNILGFAEPDGSTGKIRPVTSTSRGCKAIWNILSEAGLSAGVVNWFASHPAEPINGFVVTDRFAHAVAPPDQEWPMVPGSVFPAEFLEELCSLRVHPGATTPEQIAPFIPRLGEGDPMKDKKLQELRVLLAHCGTVHAAATALMQESDWDFMGIYYDAIDRVAHAFMEYHPPRMDHVSEEDFERYKEVMTGCYRFHDMMLGRLMNLVGDDTAVIILSDHGFHCDDLRPEGSSAIQDGQPVAWHRPYGVIAMWGPGIRAGEKLYGASLLDVTPTILRMLGLPPAEDMDGTALVQVFEERPIEIGQVETYETHTDSAAAEPEEEDPWAAQQMLEQLRQLGYLGEDDSTEGVLIDRLRNLGQVYAATGRPEEAIEQFEDVLRRKPEDKGAKMMLATCLLRLGKLDDCEAIARDVLAGDENTPRADLYLGMIALRRDDTDGALEHLTRVERSDPRMPGVQVQLGLVYLRRERWAEAEKAFDRALAVDPEDADALDGLGVAYRNQKRPQEAVLAHMRSIALLHYRPQSHINLGLALAEVGRVPWAIEAFNVAIGMDPDNPVPHRCLAELYERAVKDPFRAEEHAKLATELRQRLAK